MRVNLMVQPIRSLSAALLVAIGVAARIASAASETAAAAADGRDAHPALPGTTNEGSSATTTALTLFSTQPLSLGLFGNQTASPGLELSPEPRTLSELKRQLVRAMDGNDYERALQLADIGLANTPWDTDLLRVKGVALAKLHRYEPAIAAFKDALLAGGKDEDLICSLAELILIAGEVRDYRALKSDYKSVIEGAYGGLLVKYFDVLEAYRTGDDNQVRTAAVKLLTALPATGDIRLRNWEFSELQYAMGRQPASEKKTILLTVVRVLSGHLEREEGLQKVRQKAE